MESLGTSAAATISPNTGSANTGGVSGKGNASDAPHWKSALSGDRAGRLAGNGRGSGRVLQPTPTHDALPRRPADFATFTEAVDYAAKGIRGLNFYSPRGDLVDVLTYAELRRRALLFARRLMGLGAEPGDRVALMAETSADFVVAFTGCVYAGILPVPLPLPTSFGGKEGYLQQIGSQLASCDPRILTGPDNLIQIVRDGGANISTGQLLGWSEWEHLPLSTRRLPEPRAEETAYLQYSSGSTRFPHGIAITHRALMANCHAKTAHALDMRDSDRCISWLPFYHDMGLVGCLLAVICAQLSADYMSTDDFARRPLTWLKLISQNSGTSVSYSPTFGYDIAARRATADALAGLDLSRWRLAGNGGDMIRLDIMQTFADTFAAAGFAPSAFVPSYGLAEATLTVSTMPMGEGLVCDLIDERLLGQLGGGATQPDSEVTRYRSVVNCGRPLPGFEIEIRAASGGVLDDTRIGSVWIKGDSLMTGYFRDQDATDACLVDGWLNTGDIGYLRDGYLYIVGRAKDMLIINGCNYWPQDIEWAVEQISGLKSGDSAAFGVRRDNGIEEPVVLVHCRNSDPEQRRTLRDEVKARVRQLTGMLATVELVAPKSLPRTSSGKLARTRARTLYLGGQMPVLALPD